MHSRIITTVAILGLVGCGVFGAEDSPAPDTTPATPPPDPGTDGGLPEGAPPPPVGTPADSELTDAFGVFVSAAATPGGDGTKAHPFATIGAGIDRVKDLKLRVYVCAGTYAESLTLVNAVSVIGSLGCDGGMWTTMGTGRSIINAPTSPAIHAKDVSLATRFEGFDVTAPDGTAMSPSSIALIAENAPMLTVAKSKLTSAKGFDGADGTDGVQLTIPATANGKDGFAQSGPALANPISGPSYNFGAAGGVGSCVGAAGHDGASGGKGGAGSTQQCRMFNVGGNPVYLWTVLSAAYARSNGVVNATGTGGAGVDGASASSIGAFSATGYAPKSGTAGTDGSPGKAGSGGDGAPDLGACNSGDVNLYFDNGSGPGGGAGGCPGLAGTPGGGGGASVAALVIASPGLSLTTTELVAGAGGAGGKGAFGSTPTAGGAAGNKLNGAATVATAGGAGGRAGFSGNGAGGPSIALAHTGGEVTVAQDTHLTAGTAGAGVPARMRTDTLGNTVTIPASVGGSAMPTLAF